MRFARHGRTASPTLDSRRLEQPTNRDVRIEDLLGRPTIELDDNHVRECLDGTCVLVTGGAGSIGSELVCQALRSGAGSVWAVDTAETPLHDLTLSVRAEFGLDTARFRAVIADVKDSRAMQDVMDQSKPLLLGSTSPHFFVPERPYPYFGEPFPLMWIVIYSLTLQSIFYHRFQLSYAPLA